MTAAVAEPEALEVEYGPDERYRIYRKGQGGEPRMVLVATCPDPASVGVALCTIGREHTDNLGEAHPPVGVLDGEERKWLVSLWPKRDEQ